MHSLSCAQLHPVYHPPCAPLGACQRGCGKEVSIDIFLLPLEGGRKPHQQAARAP